MEPWIELPINLVDPPTLNTGKAAVAVQPQFTNVFIQSQMIHMVYPSDERKDQCLINVGNHILIVNRPCAFVLRKLGQLQFLSPTNTDKNSV